MVLEEKVRRNGAIDCQKGILTVLMILCHCIQFFGSKEEYFEKYIVDYINITTFSGFLFCLRYVSDKAYYQKVFSYSIKRMLKSAIRPLVSFYASSVCYIAFVDKKIFKLEIIYEILSIRRFAGWSEFLISFVGITVIGIVLFPIFKRMNGYIFFLILFISLGTSLLPYEYIKNPVLALFVGSYDYVTYPVLQYMVYYAFGILISREKFIFRKKIFLFTALISLSTIWYYINTLTLPRRFPPSILFITGAFLFVYSYYLLCNYVENKNDNKLIRVLSGYLKKVGMNSLFYLLMSNVLIFAFAGSAFSYRDIRYTFIFYLCIMLFIPYIQKIGKYK